MKNRRRLISLSLAVFVLVLYSLFYFLTALGLPAKDDASFYVGYALSVFSALLVMLSLVFVGKKHDEVDEIVFLKPFFKSALIALIEILSISLVLYFVNAFVSGLAWWMVVLCLLIPVAWYPFVFFAKKEAKEQIEKSGGAVTISTETMRGLQKRVLSIEVQSAGVRKDEIHAVSEELRFSDPVSSEETKDIEARLEEQIRQLEDAVEKAKDEMIKRLAEKIVRLLKERAVICKNSKKKK